MERISFFLLGLAKEPSVLCCSPTSLSLPVEPGLRSGTAWGPRRARRPRGAAKLGTATAPLRNGTTSRHAHPTAERSTGDKAEG